MTTFTFTFPGVAGDPPTVTEDYTTDEIAAAIGSKSQNHHPLAVIAWVMHWARTPKVGRTLLDMENSAAADAARSDADCAPIAKSAHEATLASYVMTEVETSDTDAKVVLSDGSVYTCTAA